MTKENAIAIIENEKKCVNRANKNDYCNRDCYNCELVKTDIEILTAFDVAIKALEQEPCEDCISRQALQEWIKDKSFGDIVVASEHNFDCLPPVKPQESSEDVVSRGVFEQVMWERDVAIEQLKDLGYGLGEKPKTGNWIDRWWEEGCEGDCIRWRCSECGRKESWQENFCPSCGARMVEPQENCDTCRYKDDGWDSEHCDGCCGNHSGFEPQESEDKE